MTEPCTLTGSFYTNNCKIEPQYKHFGPKTEWAVEAYNQAFKEATWWLIGSLLFGSAIYASWKYVPTEGNLAKILGGAFHGGLWGGMISPQAATLASGAAVHADFSSWARPGMMTVMALGTAVTLGFGVNAAFTARRAKTEGVDIVASLHCKVHKTKKNNPKL